MKSLIMLGLVGSMTFSVVAGGTWLVMQSNPSLFNLSQSDPEQIIEDPLAPPDDPDATSQVADQNPSMEVVVQLVQSLKRREEALESQRQQLEIKQQRVQLAISDLDRAQAEMAALHEEVAEKLTRADQLIDQLGDRLIPLADAPTSPRQQAEQRPADPISIKNERTLADWLANIEPEQAAATVREFMNDGEVDRIVRILRRLEERSVAEILGGLRDERLIKELGDALLQSRDDE